MAFDLNPDTYGKIWDDPPLVKLKDGSDVATPILISVTLVLRRLFTEHPAAFYELVQYARDQNYRILNPTPLIDRGICDVDNLPHSEITCIVRNSVEGEGLNIQLVSPLKKD